MKNFTIMYAVIRTDYEDSWTNPVVLGVFHSLEGAQDKADSWAQEFKDKNISGFKFTVQSTIFYDV